MKVSPLGCVACLKADGLLFILRGCPSHCSKQCVHWKRHGHHGHRFMAAAGLFNYSFLNPEKRIASEKCDQLLNDTYQTLPCWQLELGWKGINYSSWQYLTEMYAINTSMVEWTGQRSFAPSTNIHPTFHLPISNSSSISTPVCREDASTSTRMWKIHSTSNVFEIY